MNKKGFTLVELLAVIVILALIALIASPVILGIIKDSQDSAFKSSVNGVKKAIEQDYGDNNFNSNVTYYYGGFSGSNYNAAASSKKLMAHPTSGSNREVPMAGSIQGMGKGLINSTNGTIEIVIFTENYCGILIGSDEVKIKKITNSYKAQNCINDFDTKRGF
jgi:prepilin-type N-terminal cleavage/methylation domain